MPIVGGQGKQRLASAMCLIDLYVRPVGFKTVKISSYYRSMSNRFWHEYHYNLAVCP